MTAGTAKTQSLLKMSSHVVRECSTDLVGRTQKRWWKRRNSREEELIVIDGAPDVEANQ